MIILDHVLQTNNNRTAMHIISPYIIVEKQMKNNIKFY